MYYYEKDYIMRLIHGIARMLAKMLFDKELTDDSGLVMFRDEGTDETCDYLRRMVDNGEINAAENRLFELIESSAWEERRLAALIIVFYDYVNGKDDEFLAKAGFSREEIIRGLEDAMHAVGMDIPEYLRV
ncbi:MAG: DUF6483 family protein [Clostridiales bacterium]|nr:DUF6483 family protein [Clostridiales bacterium]